MRRDIETVKRRRDISGCCPGHDLNSINPAMLRPGRLDAVIDVAQQPAARQERGFVLVWPAKGESRWETAKRLRVAEEELHPAGKGAMLAFRK